MAINSIFLPIFVADDKSSDHTFFENIREKRKKDIFYRSYLMDLDALSVSSLRKERFLIMVVSSDVCNNANKVSSVQPVGSYSCNKDVISMGAVSLDSVQEKALRLNIKLGVYGQLCSEGLLAEFQYRKLCEKILSQSLDLNKEWSYTEQQLAEVTAKKPVSDGYGDEGEREVYVQ